MLSPLAFVQQAEITALSPQRFRVSRRRTRLDLLAHSASCNVRLESRGVVEVAHNEGGACVANWQVGHVHRRIRDVIHPERATIAPAKRPSVWAPVVETCYPPRQ